MNRKKLNLLVKVLILISALEVFSFLWNHLPINKGTRLTYALAIKGEMPSYQNIDSKIEPRMRPHPYFLYDLTPNYTTKKGVQHNSLGYRNKEFSFYKKNKKRILILGGSTTYGAGVEKVEETWPSEFQRVLNESDKNYEVINGGVDAAASPEILIRWFMKNQFLKPDIVILHMGVNDTLASLTKVYDSEYRGFREPAGLLNFNSNFIILLRHSNFAEFVFRNLIINTNSSYPYNQAGIKYSQFKNEKELNNAIKEASNFHNIGYERNLSEICKSLKSKGIKILFVLEPIAPTSQLSSGPSPVPKGSEKIFEEALKTTAVLSKKIIKENDGSYFDLNDTPIHSNLFFDNCHLVAAGESMKARLIFNKLKNYI